MLIFIRTFYYKISNYYESQCLLDYETHSSEFKSDVCLEYIKVYERDDKK